MQFLLLVRILALDNASCLVYSCASVLELVGGYTASPSSLTDRVQGE